MREIKFRAWDKKLKFIHDDVYISAEGVAYTTAHRTYDTPNTEIDEGIYSWCRVLEKRKIEQEDCNYIGNIL